MRFTLKSNYRPFITTSLFTLLALSSHLNGDPSGPSTWTGAGNNSLQQYFNWDNGVPYDGVAIFNGNGDNAPVAKSSPIDFDQIEFTAETQLSIITKLNTNGSAGVSSTPGTSATVDIYEHQYPTFTAAEFNVTNGPAGDGGGTVTYNLEGYGQFYTHSGSAGSTKVNVLMTEGNNYFEITNPGINTFDNVSSSSQTDEISLPSGVNLTIRGSGIIEGVIVGDGSLTKTGSGILKLNNDNSYTGDTLVDAGILELNGSVSGNVTVGLNGLLKGNGTIGGSLICSGKVSPGNSIGTLTTTNFSPTSANIYEVEVNSAGESDRIVATNTATLAGSVNVIPLSPSFDITAPLTYNILEAGTSVTGTFSNLTSTVPALMQLTYDPNNVFLTYLPLSAVGLNDNALAAASCFTTLTSADAEAISLELLNSPFAEIQTAFNQMQPSQLSALTWTQLTNALLISSSYSKQLEFSYNENCCDGCQNHVWVDGVGQWQQQDSKNNQLGFHDVTGGISLGADTYYENFRLGAAASYTYSDLNWAHSAGSGTINSYYGGVYGRWSDNCKYINVSALGNYNNYKTSRHLHFGDIDRHARSNHNGWGALGSVEIGMYSDLAGIKVIPFGKIDYVYQSQEKYHEHGADSLNLEIAKRHDQLLQSEVGVILTDRYQYNCECGSGTLIPRFKLSYINQAPLTKNHYEANFVDSSCQFAVSGWDFMRNLGAISAGLTYLSCNERIGVTVRYDGQFGSKYWSQGADILLTIQY